MRAFQVFLPLITYPEPVADAAIMAAVRFSRAIKSRVTATAYAVDIPQVSTPLGGMLLDLPGLAHAAEAKSRMEADRLLHLVKASQGDAGGFDLKSHQVTLGGVNDAATITARTCDFAVVPWAPDAPANDDLIQSLVFGAGRPIVLVPASFDAPAIDHVAIAWDGSRVAARALGDALPLLTENGRVTVLTVGDEKPLGQDDLAGDLAAALTARGIRAEARSVSLQSRPIGIALQEAAKDAGASLLAMGGFGHSRLRDFVLGGATTGVLTDLRIATLISH